MQALGEVNIRAAGTRRDGVDQHLPIQCSTISRASQSSHIRSQAGDLGRIAQMFRLDFVARSVSGRRWGAGPYGHTRRSSCRAAPGPSLR